jgi:ATP-dependent Clp protease ATP-binding subunit ClpB
MTSNVGSHWIKELGGTDDQAMRERVLAEMDRQFRPEFLNRIDEILIFSSLTMEDLVKIVDIQMKRLAAILQERSIGLDVTEEARRYLAKIGYDPVYGARPLKRTIQRELQDPIALRILEGEFAEGDTIHVDSNGEALSLSKATAPQPIGVS